MEIKQFVLKYFLKKAELGNHISKIKNKKEERGTIQPSEPCPQKQNKKKPLQQTKEKRGPDFMILSRQQRRLSP